VFPRGRAAAACEHAAGAALWTRGFLTIFTMSDTDILYHRTLPYGPVVRIRRTTAPGVRPVRAVLEVDRRAGTPREGVGYPPPLLQCEADDDRAVLAQLEPHARDDRAIVQLMRDRGQR
jgi:hypothetical protein